MLRRPGLDRSSKETRRLLLLLVEAGVPPVL